MVWFFRDFLNGWVYLVVAFLSLIFIMAIIGFMMERKKFEEEEKNRIAVLSNDAVATPLNNNDVNVGADSISSIDNTVSQEEIKPAENAATSDAIPEILNFDKIEENMKEK